MRILAIETSCDETAVAVVSDVDGRFVVEKQALSSQIKTHAAYGGVVPEVAARMHLEALVPMLAELGIPRDGVGVDAIAVTAGPGLVVALRVGVETAKTLALVWNKPLVAVNHLEGHIASVWMEGPPALPALALIVSGGHTGLVLVEEFGSYRILGETRDDAAGEAFDKVAKLLGLGYPGGPEIARMAKEGDREAITFPRPMLDADNFDFSFSGLKTAVLLEVQRGTHTKEDVAASFEEAVVDTLVAKTQKAVERFSPSSVLVVGGVSANERLREKLSQALTPLPCVIPGRQYSTDNAVMIAIAGIQKARLEQFCDPRSLEADPHLSL